MFSKDGLSSKFWIIPEVAQKLNELRIEKRSGIPSEMLFQQQPMEQNVGLFFVADM